jgi:hypothetical protein
VRLEGRKAVLQAFISILAQPHRETHRNDRRRWVSLSLNPSYKPIALNHLNGSKH